MREITYREAINEAIKEEMRKDEKIVAYGEDIAEYPLMALETVDQGSLFSRMWDYIVLLFKSFF